MLYLTTLDYVLFDEIAKIFSSSSLTYQKKKKIVVFVYIAKIISTL